MADLTHSEIKERLEDRRQVLASLHTQMAIDETFIVGSAVMNDASLMQYLKGFPPGFLARIPPIAIDAVHRLRNQVIVGETPDVILKMPSSRRGEDKEERANEDKEEAERFLKAELAYIETVGTESPFLIAADHCFGLGLAVMAYPLVMDRLPKHPFKGRQARNSREKTRMREYERQRRGAWPFDVHTVHPITAFFDVYHDPIEDMIIEQDILLGHYARFEHLGIGTAAYKTHGTLVSYCSPQYYGYWLNDKPLLLAKDGANDEGIAPNTTGVLWYKMARAGWGFQTARNGWEYAIKGVIRDARALILSLITDYNVQEVMKLLYVWPEDEIEAKDEEGRAEVEERRRGPGALWVHGTKVRVIPSDGQQIPQWAFQVQNLNTGMAEAHLGSRVLSGVDEDDTASGLRTRIGLAKAPTRTTQHALKRLASGLLSDIVYMQKYELGKESLMIPTSTGYASFEFSKLSDDAIIDIDFTPMTDEEKAFKLEDLVKRKQVGAASIKRIVYADPGIDDPEEEMIEIDADNIMAQGDLLKAASQEALRRFQERVSAPVPGALPGETGQVATLGSPQDVERQNEALQPLPGGPALQGLSPL